MKICSDVSGLFVASGLPWLLPIPPSPAKPPSPPMLNILKNIQIIMTRYMYRHLCEMGERIAQMRPKHWVIFGVATPSPIKIMPCL